MKILRSYILKEFVSYFFISLCVLTFIVMLGNIAVSAFLIIGKGVEITTVIKLFLLLILNPFNYTIPVACLAATVLALRRLSSDNEIIAIRANGINIFHVVFPLAIVGVILSLFLIILNDKIIPRAHYEKRKTMVELGIKKPTAALEAGRYINTFQRYIIFINRIEENYLHNIVIYEPQKQGRPARTIVAKKGEFITYPEKMMVKLKLIDGTADQPDPRNPDQFFKMVFKVNFMNLNLEGQFNTGGVGKKDKDRTLKELRQEITSLRAKGINPTQLYLSIHERLAMSFSCLVFILIAIPLSIITNQRARSFRIIALFTLTILFYISFIGILALCSQGILIYSGVWLVNLVFGLAGIIMIFRLCAS